MHLVDENTKVLLDKRKYIWNDYQSARSHSEKIKQAFSTPNDNFKALPPPALNLPAEVTTDMELLSKNAGTISSDLQTISQYEGEIKNYKNQILELEGKVRMFYIAVVVVVVILMFFILG